MTGSRGARPGTETGEASADWIAAEMERVGLEPGGTGWRLVPDGRNGRADGRRIGSGLSFSGGASERDYEMTLGEDAVIWTKRQEELELSFADSELVFVGYGVVAPEYGWNDYAGLDAEGKTVVMLVNDPGFATQDPDLFKGKAMTYYGRWTYKYEEAARQGAQAPSSFMKQRRPPMAGMWCRIPGRARRLTWCAPMAVMPDARLEGWITLDTARSLFADGGLDFEEMKRAARTPGFTPVDMGELTASGKISQTVTRAQSRNVSACLEGETEPGEYMLFTAHWDHLGKKSAEKQASRARISIATRSITARWTMPTGVARTSGNRRGHGQPSRASARHCSCR